MPFNSFCRLGCLLETSVFILVLSVASSALARPPTAQKQRRCELRLLQPDKETTSTGRRLRAHDQHTDVAMVGLAAFIVGYAGSIITSISLGSGIFLSAIPAPSAGSSGGGDRSPPMNKAQPYWVAPLIPFVGAFIFAGHASIPGYVAPGATFGVLQVLGGITFVYALATRPRSPCEHMSLDHTGFTLRF